MKKWCLLFVPVLLLLPGCATSAKMSAQDVAQLKPNEGRVIGSVLLKVPSEKDASSWAWLKGRKAENFKYSLTIEPRSVVPNPFARRYGVVAGIGQEETFIMKLPAGEYEFTKMEQLGFSNLEANIRRGFAVTAGHTTYIGRLVIEFPERLVVGSRFDNRVDDMQEETLASAKGQYGDAVANVVKSLAR